MLDTLQIDWLSAHVGAPLKNIPCNMGDYDVIKLPYSTRQFKNVYNIYESNQHLATIATQPASKILHHDSGILKLSNSILYTESHTNILRNIMKRLHLQFRGITRLDIAYDNTVLYNNLKHTSLIKGLLNEKYCKTGRSKGALNFSQDVDLHYEYLKFGTKHGDVSSYMYNKSLEMREVKYKPYITEQWIRNKWNGLSDVWRIEFAIKSHRAQYVSHKSGIMYDMKSLDILSDDGIETMFYQMLHRHFRFKYKDMSVRLDHMKDVKLIADNTPVTKRFNLTKAKDSTKTDKNTIRKISELQSELRGVDFDLAIHCNEVLNYIILSRGLHKWAKDKIDNYTASEKVQQLTMQQLYSIASNELHKEGFGRFQLNK